jgi:hypothetical protein
MTHYNGSGVNRLFQGGKEQPLMFDVNSSHPIIPNSQDYTVYKKYVSIHSEDRDMLKFPQSSSFEIELPQDYLNVITVRMSNWTFPSNYDTFSILNSNVTMTFQINNPYNPGTNGYADPLQNAIFEGLYGNENNNYSIQISNGFYTPDQIATELTNRFNTSISVFLQNYLGQFYPTLVQEFKLNGGYQDFVIVYNNVQQNIHFGNRSSGFLLTNENAVIKDVVTDSIRCGRNQLPDFSSWGLPGFIGLSRLNMDSQPSFPQKVRFYYGDVNPGDDGFWLIPNLGLPGAQIYFIDCPFKINLMGPSHMYLDLDGLNCLDETSPYNLSQFTQTTNQTNGIVNSSFCKIPVPTTPLSQWFDKESPYYKLFLPPAERIRKIKVKLRYHDGQLVNFGTFSYTFTLEFVMYSAQQPRASQLTMSKYI